MPKRISAMVADRAAVVTGIGVVAPGGADRETFWANIRHGISATRRTTLCDPEPFRSQVAGEAPFDSSTNSLTWNEVNRLDRAAQLLIVAADEAANDSCVFSTPVAPERVGVYIGSAVGATTSMESIYRSASHDGQLVEVDKIYNDDLYDYLVPSSFVAVLAERFCARGPGELVSNGCTSGLDSLGRAMDAIHSGTVDVAIAGATEAPIAAITYACFDAILATSNLNNHAESASRPYDLTRSGFVLAEGSAVFIIESKQHAWARNAKCYGVITGYGARSNAYHMTGLRADGTELAAAISAAIDSAGLLPHQLDYVNAHGSATTQNDIHETSALKQSLGDYAYEVAVSSTKSMTGHSMGSIGSIEAAVCLLAIRDSFIPPTANLTRPDSQLDLDYVPNVGREHEVHKVLSIASGFGGFQSALVLEDIEHDR